MRSGTVRAVDDLYARVAEAVGRVAAFGGFGAVVGAVAATIEREFRENPKASYGEWAAYSAGLAGLFAAAFEVFRAV